MDFFDRLKKTEDPVKRRAYFIAFLTKETLDKCKKMPIVVGGEALEIYTQGGYTTGDIDIKGPKDCISEILNQWKFEKQGRIWFNTDLDIYIDWLGESLDEGPEAEERTNIIILEDDLKIRVISIEDLIIDRLNSARWWKDEDAIMWARVLLEVKLSLDEKIDALYLKKRARQQGIEDMLEDLLKGIES